MLLASSPVQAQVNYLEVTPAVIDEKAMARDILKYTVTLKNVSQSKLELYTFVHNLSAETGQQEFLDPSKADFSTSLANWIGITRGNIELWPGDEKELELSIQVNMRALPGQYHAAISFVHAPNRAEAETKLASAPKILVNVEVIEDIKEILELDNFTSDKSIFTGSVASFKYKLRNAGNREQTPSGEIRIFDRRGAEISVIDANPDAEAVAAGEELELTNSWQDITKFGRYKANLVLSYGADSTRRVQDSVSFYVVPKMVLGIFIGILAIVLILIGLAVFYLPRKYEPPAFLPDKIEEIYEYLPWHQHHSRLQELHARHHEFRQQLEGLEEHLPRKHVKKLHQHHWELTEELAQITDELAMHLPWHLLEEEETEIQSRQNTGQAGKKTRKQENKKANNKNKLKKAKKSKTNAKAKKK
jgi:hypothetical protein